MSQSKFRSFLTGTFVGVGLGILLAPKEGNETRNDLKKSFSLLMDTIKDIDIEETKENLLKKVSEIKKELSQMDAVTIREVAEEKVDFVKEKCDDLMKLAKEKGAPVVERAAKEVKESASTLLHEFLDELEEETNKEEKKVIEEEKKTTTKPKKKKEKSGTTRKTSKSSKKKSKK